MKLNEILRGALFKVTGVFVGNRGEAKGRAPYEHSTSLSDASVNAGIGRIANNHQNLAGQDWERVSFNLQVGTNPINTLISDFWIPRTIGKETIGFCYFVFSYPICSSPRKLIVYMNKDQWLQKTKLY